MNIINLQLMTNKMIPFPFEIKITHSDFSHYVFTILFKIDGVEALFYFIFLFVLLWLY